MATDDDTGPIKGDGKKRPTLKFADPTWAAPDFLDFLGFAQIECTEQMSGDYNNMALIIQVWYSGITFRSVIFCRVCIINTQVC